MLTAAALLALSGCEGEEPDAAPTEPSMTTAAASDAGGGPAPTSFAPLGTFPTVSLAPMDGGEGGGSSTGVSADNLAEIGAEMVQVEPGDVSCSASLRAGNATPVSCTVESLDQELTAYPVHGDPDGETNYSLVVDGTLTPVQSQMVMDPDVSTHYGPTSLFFDDPALLEPDGLVDRAQGELEALGLSEELSTCEGVVGEGTAQSGVRCTGTRQGERSPVEVQLYPTFAEDGEPVTLALVHRLEG